MTLLEDICTYFTDKHLVEGAGIDTFTDFMPEAPDNIVVINEYQGDAVSQFTNELHRSVQIIVRNTSTNEARRIADKLFEALKSSTEDRRIDFTPDRWGQVYLRQSPFKLTQDDTNRTSYCFNLGITTKL